MGESNQPAHLEPDLTPPGSAPATDAAAQDKPRILVIDDSRVIRRAISKILNAEFQITEAEDGEAGWNALLADPSIQVVISDVEMPRMNGFELTSRLRADKELSEVPVVLVTALETREDRERGIEAGANAYMIKSSFNQNNLLEIIKRLTV